jgi:glycosyltransferase involved in cell wall biosynthesis
MRILDTTFHSIVYLSEGNRRSYAANLGRSLRRSKLIGNGVDATSVCADRSLERRRSVRWSIGLPVDPEIAVMVGSLVERKGPLDFIRAARVAASMRPTMHFAIIGDGDLRAASEELARELSIADRVHFLGHRQNVRELLSSFDIYAQPSHFEGMSIAMLEALAAGLPLVTTRVDGVEDVLPGGGALTVGIGDSQALGMAMAQMAAEPALRAQLSSVSRSRVLSHFSLERMCERYADLYRSLGAVA